MADEELINKIHELSDLELAALICLVAEEHCIIDTDPDALGDLVQELQLVNTPPVQCPRKLLMLIRSHLKSLA